MKRYSRWWQSWHLLELKMPTDKNLKINLSFNADEALMYLIQQVTKLPTEEILGFFYDLGVKVTEIGIENMIKDGTHSCRKDMRNFYPNSCVPFKLMVKGSKYKTVIDGALVEVFNGSLSIEFPDKSRTVDQQALMDRIIEKTLLDGESLPNFPKPLIKQSKMYKKLIEEVYKK